MFTLFKGILIGLGKILPGVSGSLIAISMGLYDKMIKIISELKIKENIIFLFKIGLGIVTGIVVGSKLVSFCLNKYYLYTMSVIIGVLICSIMNIFKIEKPKTKKDWLFILFSFIFVLALNYFGDNKTSNNQSYFFVVFLGFIDAVTMIIPGVSGTAIYMILGAYEFVLSILSNILNKYMIFFCFGLLLGIYITTKIINYFLDNYHKKFYMLVLGFTISSLFLIIKLTYITYSKEMLFSPLFIIFGFVFGIFFNHE